jgi:outer membrane biosynthesis protein TonB
MSLRLPTRTLAPVLVLAVLGGVFATFMLTRLGPPSEREPKVIKPKGAPTAAVQKPVKPAAKPKAPVRKQAVTPAAKPKAKPKPKPVPVVPVAKPKPAEPKPDNGLPAVLNAALAQNRVVVVGLYDPASAVDKISLDEARAGAKAAGVGFVAINVFAEAQSRPLVKLLGALENPGVLVYRKPDTLFARFSGFADGDTVAQAAANALR